jgi:simple sugar transport system ATP-binding protein
MEGMDRPPGATAPRLELRHVGKSFPGVRANDDVSFAVAPGEIHALLGENGAGKSTLMKIVYGVQRADEGEICWEGRPVEIASPKAARRLGVGMVFQHFSLFDALTVYENIAVGMDDPLPRKALEARIEEVLATYGLPLDITREVHTLSVGERQRIEIVRCLMQQPRLLIMDEPTSVLTPQEVEKLFTTLRQLSHEGVSILYISHKLHEIKALCHAATILRGGRVVGTCDPRVETARSMAELMIGGELRTAERRGKAAGGEERRIVEGLSVAGKPPFGIDLKSVSFTVRAGEVMGIAGVAGNGQNELTRALAGEVTAPRAEMIRVAGRPIGRQGPGERRRGGLCVVPEERNGHAAVPDFTLAENAMLTARYRKPLTRGGVLRLGAARDYAREVIERFGVRTTGPAALARSLSGGNLQKFIVGREMMQAPDVLVVSQPTWGVDAGAASFIHQALLDLAGRGCAIVVISQDLDELMTLASRLAVMNEGRLSQALDAADVSVKEIGLLMGGIHGGDAPTHPHEVAHAV